MKKHLKMVCFSVALLGMAPLFVSAENNVSAGISAEASAEADAGLARPIKAGAQNIKELKTERRDAVKSAVQNIRAGAKAALAEKGATTTRAEVRANAKADIKAGAARVKEIRATTSAQIRAERAAMKLELIKKHRDQAVRILRAAADRLTKLANRIESRIQKFEAAGASLADSKTKLARARELIAAARTDIDAAANMSIIIGAGADVSSSLTTPLREAVRKAKESLKIAHRALVDTVNSMKPGASGLGAKLRGNATSTVTATTTSGQ